MSLLARPSVVFAIVLGCFAVLVPRVFIPLFRTKPSTPAHNFEDNFRRPPAAVSRNENGDTVEHIHGSPPHVRGAHPGMRMHHPGASARPPVAADQGASKSIVTLALPMYTVGIGVFFLYTCCKYWSRKSDDESKNKSTEHRWNTEKRKLGYDILDKDSEEEDEHKHDIYTGLDPDYIEYLKSKKQKALDAQQAMTEEQKQMHYALEEMKKSLSFISSKLITKESRGNLDNTEIVSLQERLMSTEAQMCKILSALDTASDKVAEVTKNAKTSAQISDNFDQEESFSSSDEEDETDNKSDQRNRSESISSSCSSTHSSIEEDQSAPTDEQNHLIRRKHH